MEALAALGHAPRGLLRFYALQQIQDFSSFPHAKMWSWLCATQAVPAEPVEDENSRLPSEVFFRVAGSTTTTYYLDGQILC